MEEQKNFLDVPLNENLTDEEQIRITLEDICNDTVTNSIVDDFNRSISSSIIHSKEFADAKNIIKKNENQYETLLESVVEKAEEKAEDMLKTLIDERAKLAKALSKHSQLPDNEDKKQIINNYLSSEYSILKQKYEKAESLFGELTELLEVLKPTMNKGEDGQVKVKINENLFKQASITLQSIIKK